MKPFWSHLVKLLSLLLLKRHKRQERDTLHLDILHFKGFKPAYSIANLGGLYYLHSYLQSKGDFR